MQLNKKDDIVEVSNKENEILLAIEYNENILNFLDNWYFLNNYLELNKFKKAFVVNYI